jgi:HK97 family phage major capsid protein
MKINDALRAAMTKRFGAPAGATDEQIKALVGAKVASGELDAQELVEMSKSADSPRDKLTSLVQGEVKAAMTPVVEAIGALAESVKAIAIERTASAPENVQTKRFGTPATPPAAALRRGGAPDVKSVEKMYSTTKSALIGPERTKDGKVSHHPFAGRQVQHMGRSLDTISDLEKACTGAFIKQQVSSQMINPSALPPGLRLTDHDRELLKYAAHELPWTGYLDGLDHGTHEVKDRKLTDFEVKALLDGDTSGGSAVVPIVYDQAIIETPLLYGQLFPLVDLVPLSQGRVIQSALFSNPTINSGPREGGSPSITVESAAGYITQIDTLIHDATGAFKIGRDFSEDTPIDVQEIVTRTFGYAFQAWLDMVIAVGNGSTQPLGVASATGLTSVSSSAGTNGPGTLGDLEAMIFGVPLEVRTAQGGRCAYVSTDTAYRRIRGMANGADDQRRVFGMDTQQYRTFDYPHKVSQSIGDSTLIYGNWAYYRMWRRRGFDLRVEMGGQTLGLENTMLLIGRARFGGNVMLSSAFAKMSNFANFAGF